MFWDTRACFSLCSWKAEVCDTRCCTNNQSYHFLSYRVIFDNFFKINYMKYNIQKKYFEEKYKTKNNIWSIIPTGKEAKNFLRLMKKYKPKGRMVDLGCGNGKFARFFAKNG